MKQIGGLADILSLFTPGSTVVLHSAFAEPTGLGAQLAGHCQALSGVRVFSLMSMGTAPYASSKPAKALSLNTFFPGSSTRKAINDGRVQLWPERLSAIPPLFDSGKITADFLFLQVSAPDKDGNMSLGISVDYMRSVMMQNPIIVAEVNSKMPYTYGDTVLSADQIDYAIDATEPPQTIPLARHDDIDERIAENVAGLLEDGVVVQFGIGSIPDLTLSRMGHLRNIGIHSGLITDAIVPLMKAGVVTNATKREFTGKVVTTMAGGTQAFYDFLHTNPAVAFQPSSYTHNMDVLAGIDRFFAINSVLQIDLAGRANAERIGSKIISSPGGLPDFARGATASNGGASVIAMRSTALGGQASSIVPSLSPSAPVTIDADHIDYVVTEHGVAHIRGLDVGARAAALANIAHPEFRTDLLTRRIP